MPLTKRQFELGVDEEGEEFMRRVYQFLSAHPELAYSQDEIQEMIRAQDPSADEIKVEKTLEMLSGIGAVEKRQFDSTGYRTDYFAFLQEFDTGTWMSAKHSKL